MMSSVLLLLYKFESHCPILGTIVTHPSYQNGFDVTVCSFNRALTLGISGLAKNQVSRGHKSLSSEMTLAVSPVTLAL